MIHNKLKQTKIMADLNPLKFQVAIQDEATKKLNEIEKEFDKLKDKTISVSVNGLDDLRSLLTLLQHRQVQNIGKEVASGINEATKSLQEQAQKAIRDSLGKLAEDLTLIKHAIQHDNFTAFSTRITKCAEAVNTLDEAFKKFHVTIGKDEGMRNFMTGLGEVIRNVRSTMGMINGGLGSNANVTPDALSRSIKVAQHETERLNNNLVRAQRTIETFGDKGFNVAALERYKTALIDVRENLRLIEKNGGAHPISGMTASQYLSSEDASRVVTLLRTELSYYQNIGKELERIASIRSLLNSTLTSNPNTSYRSDIEHAIVGLDLREGLLGRQTTRDSMQTLNSNEYRQQIQEAVSLISKVSEESRKSEKDNAHLIESMRKAGIAVSDLAAKFDKLEIAKIRANAVKAHVDTSAYDRAVERMERYKRVLEYIAQNGGHDAGRILQSVGYRNASNDLNIQAAALKTLTADYNRASVSAQQLAEQERQLAMAFRTSTQEAKGQSQILGDLKSLATQYLGVWGGQQFLNNIIKIGGQLESQRLSLTAILGQRSYANELFANIQNLALKSPFGVVQLDQYSKNLSAFGFQYNELFDMTKRLADIAAGTGTDFGRLALALGHVRSEMALTGYTLRQFSMANVPMLKMLAENIGVTTSEIRKMVREKKISYEDVEKVLKDLTNEGGMFYNMQEVMSEAVSAKFKNLKDAMDIMYGQMAESFVGDMLKGIAAALTEVTKRWQTFGTVIASTAAIIGMYKLYMYAVNAGIKANTANILENTISTKALTREEVQHLAVTNQITRAELVNAVATGKLSAAQAELAANYFVLDMQMLKNVEGMKRYQLAAKGIAGSNMMAMLTNPWTATLIAVEAVIGAVMAYKSWSDNIYGDVNRVLEQAKTASEEIGKYLKESKSDGKPTNERDLSTEIEQMKTILKNSQLYTEELETQVNLAPNLSAEYDVLIGKMKEANANLSKSGVNAETIAEAIKNTSGDFWAINPLESLRFYINDDINENSEDLDESLAAYQRIITANDEYKEAMENAMTTMIEFYGHSELMNLPLSEQIRLLASDEQAWNQFVNLVDNGSGKFVDVADKLKDAAEDVTDDWDEIVNDDVPRMMEKLAALFGKTPDQFREWAKTHNDIFQSMLNTMISAVSKASPTIANYLRKAVLGWLEGISTIAFGDRVETEAEKQARLKREAAAKRAGTIKGYGQIGSYAMRTLVDYAAKHGKGDKNGNGLFDIDFVGEYFKADSSTSAGLEALAKDYKKYKGLVEAARKSGNKAEEKQYERRFNQLDVAMDAFGLDKTKGDKKSTDKDKEAKTLRERVRILKEAADSFQYWRDKVGDKGAVTHVNEEFGKLLGEQGFDFLDVENFRKTLTDLRSEYEKKPQSKAMIEALKELDKELAKLDRKDFEKSSEDYLSRMKIELEDLTRSWEIYNKVRKDTGDERLAEQLSGFNSNFRTVADAMKAKLEEDLSKFKLSNAVAFNENLSDKEIEESIRNAVPKDGAESAEEYEKKIQSLIEAMKKWRDIQRDVIKSDLSTFSTLIGSAVDLQSEVVKINEEYQELIDTLNNLRGNGRISGSQYNRGVQIATANRDMKLVEASSSYRLLMDSVVTLSKDAAQNVKRDFVDALTRQLQSGAITAKEYADKIEDINHKMKNLEDSQSGIMSYSKGGLQGLFDNMMNRGKGMMEQGGSMFQEASNNMSSVNIGGETYQMPDFKGMSQGMQMSQMGANMMQGAQGAMTTMAIIDAIVHGINNIVQGLKGTFDEIREMFKALGKDVNTDGWEDTNTFLSSFSKASASATKGWDSLKNGDAGGVIEGVVGSFTGWITGFAQGHDKKRQNHIDALMRNVKALDANTEVIKSLRDRQLGYDIGKLRKAMAEVYNGNDAASKAMREFYLSNMSGNGYAQEIANLKKEREDYLQMYNEEDDKKDSSEEALIEYKSKIAELDEQIRYFTEDLAKELWDIDIKGWADQLSDGLTTAFENGESAAKAYKDTVTNILQSVMNKMLQMAVLEPMFQNLQDLLFGNSEKNIKGVFDVNNPKGSMAAVISTIGSFFGSGGEGEQAITAALEFMNAFERGLNSSGLSVLNKDNANTLSSGIQGTSEETSDLLAGYVNAARQDLSASRILLMQFVAELWPTYIEQVATAIRSLNNIDQNVAFIRVVLSENGALYMMLDSMRSHLDQITNGNEQVSVK